MASYVLLQGLPSKEACQVFGLTPREALYIKVCLKKSNIHFLNKSVNYNRQSSTMKPLVLRVAIFLIASSSPQVQSLC